MLSKWLVFVLFLLGANVVLDDQVTCETLDNRRTECPMDTRGEVRLIRQLSDSPCRMAFPGICSGTASSAVTAGTIQAAH
jgi:hypothetical protein